MEGSRQSRLSSRVVAAVALMLSLRGIGGCASDGSSKDVPAAGGIGGVAGSGGATASAPQGTGGVSGSGGTSPGSGGTADGGGGGGGATAGGAGTSPDAGAGGAAPGDGGTCVVPTTLIDATAFPACDKTVFPLCTNGRCVPKTAVPTDAQSQLGDCDATNKCVPSYFIERAAKFVPPSCTSVNGAEGRCLSECIPQISAQASFLQKGTCGDGDLCAPCYDPRTGKDTGACSQGCDTGPKDPPKPFAKCCTGRGSCVTKDLVPAADLALLGKDTCSTADQLCAPDNLSDPAFQPKKCMSLAGAEGRCTVDCLPSVAQQASRLPPADCAKGELCAPCYDPISGKDTGACTQNGDKPVDPPVVFAGCCGTFGHCVPDSILSTDQKASLAKDTCTGQSDLCAPDVFAVPGQMAAACRALGSADLEGRCLPPCLPSVAAQKSELDAGSCAAGLLCVPCFDPITGASTSACTQNGDMPKDAKKVFPNCCSGAGTCVPTSLVPAAELAQLGKDTCTATGALCAPTAFIDPKVQPKACTASGNVEARCLPSCLPPVQAQKANLRQVTCAANELCTPCFNPLDGTDTGACHTNGDAPKQPKTVFAGCCPYPAMNGTNRGTCVPPDLVSTSQAAILPQDSCATNFLCAPTVKVKDQTAKFKSCQVPILSLACLLGCAGGCVPDCIVPAAEKSFLAQGTTCAAGELCAPCTDPTTSKSSGACD